MITMQYIAYIFICLIDYFDSFFLLYLRVTMMADGCAQAVMRVTMKRKMRKGMSVLQVRSHFPDTAKPFSFR